MGFSAAFCRCSRIAASCSASAPNRPLPTNDSGGLWYTDARVDSSVRSCSSRAGGRLAIVVVMAGLSERTIFYRG